MYIKDFDFTSMHAVRKQCWTYKADGNTPIKKGKNLYPLESITECDDFKGFFVEIIKHTYGDCSYIIWNDLGNSCVKYGIFHPASDVSDTEQMKDCLLPDKGLDGFKEKLYIFKENNSWINNAEILALADNGEVELAVHYQEYHDRLNAELEEKERRQRRIELEKERKRQEEISMRLNQTEQNIRNKKDFKNDLIDGKSIVLCLMDKYGIKVPIKTQGWFNQKLAFVKWIDGEISYSYYRTKGTNGSQTAFKYLRMLEEAINAA